MNDNLLGGAFELSLRYLLLMDNTDEYITEKRLCLLDYMVTYAGDFGMNDYNLHGNGDYRSGEYWSRQSLAKDALKSLVRMGLADVRIESDDFVYGITESGSQFCGRMESDYANEYLATASFILQETVDCSDGYIQDMVYSVINETKDRR